MQLSYCPLFVSESRTRYDGVEIIELRRTKLAQFFGIRPTVVASGTINASRYRLQIGSGIHCHSVASLIALGYTFGVASNA